MIGPPCSAPQPAWRWIPISWEWEYFVGLKMAFIYIFYMRLENFTWKTFFEVEPGFQPRNRQAPIGSEKYIFELPSRSQNIFKLQNTWAQRVSENISELQAGNYLKIYLSQLQAGLKICFSRLMEVWKCIYRIFFWSVRIMDSISYYIWVKLDNPFFW